MRSVNVHEAKTQLSRLLEEVEAGGEIVIARAGVPVAILKPYVRDRPPRRLGTALGQVQIADDFDELPADMQAALLGESE
jgi:prevent-host-death family protein